MKTKLVTRICNILIFLVFVLLGLFSIIATSNDSADEMRTVVFHSTRDGNTDIYSVKTDGSNETRLTNHSAKDNFARLSADGQKIAFVSERDGNSEIYVMDNSGENEINLTSNAANDFNPGWSPDGQKLAFLSTRDGNEEIYIMNDDGSIVRRMTFHSELDDQPEWSPDGQKIVFRSARDHNVYTIWVVTVNSGELTQIVKYPDSGHSPTWSADGLKICYVRPVPDLDKSELWAVNSDGTSGGAILLGENAFAFSFPVWSKIESESVVSKIVYVSYRDDQHTDISIVNADGSGRKKLTNDTIDDGNPCFGILDQYIVFTRIINNNTDIYIMKAEDGSDLKSLTNNPGNDFSPHLR